MTVESVIGPQTVNSDPTCPWTSLMQVNCKAHIKLQLKRKNHERSDMPRRAVELIVKVCCMLLCGIRHKGFAPYAVRPVPFTVLVACGRRRQQGTSRRGCGSRS